MQVWLEGSTLHYDEEPAAATQTGLAAGSGPKFKVMGALMHPRRVLYAAKDDLHSSVRHLPSGPDLELLAPHST